MNGQANDDAAFDVIAFFRETNTNIRQWNIFCAVLMTWKSRQFFSKYIDVNAAN